MQISFELFLAAKVPVHSNFHLDRWFCYSDVIHDKAVLQFLVYGWPINFSGSTLPISTTRNHPSAQNNIDHLRKYIQTELSSNSIVGPFPANHFDTACVISPLLCVPKRDCTTPRVVHDLSFPESNSVNAGIPKDTYLNEPFKLRLPGVDRLISFILE